MQKKGNEMVTRLDDERKRLDYTYGD